MKFSEAWLREWVDPDIDRPKLLEQLTMAGLEIEAVTPVAPELRGVVVARVESTTPHPTKRLSVCQVSDGDQVHQVACGAANVRPGMVSALARANAVLAGGTTIEAAEIHGVTSAGMLCSAAELGLGDDASGILELASNLTLGMELQEALCLADVCIDVDLTPNRGDCLSLRGLAREVGVLNDLPVRQQRPVPARAEIATAWPVHLEDAKGCPRYLGRVISGVDIGVATPFWMRERLRRAGLRSINAVVDVTNYVMLELGQPMHAFDLAALAKPIVVRRAVAGETLELLDGRQIDLDPSILIIADGAGPVAIAGVMGGIRSGVELGTREVFLECAYFDPLTVAGTVRRFGLHTDASHRYERGVDYNLPALAMERATALLLDIVSGRAGPVTVANDPAELPKERRVSLRQKRLRELAGVDIEPAKIDALFKRLDFKLLKRRETPIDGIVWTIAAPSHRFDIQIEADLVEEVCRIHGYDNIPSLLPTAPLALGRAALEQSSERRFKTQLAASGFQELITYSFVDPALQNLLDPDTKPARLANPMSSEQSVLRTNLLPGLVEALRFNQNRQRRRMQAFELGYCFKPGTVAEQELRLGGLMWGDRNPQNWHEKPAAMDFFDLKGAVERLLEWAGGGPVSFAASDAKQLHPGQQATVQVGGEEIGRLGRLHPAMEQRLELGFGVCVFELAAQAALAHQAPKFREIPKTPSASRDLCVLVDESITAEQIRTTLMRALAPKLAGFSLFDVYRGKDIEPNKKSVAVGLTFQDASYTLTEVAISHCMDNALLALQAELGAQLR